MSSYIIGRIYCDPGTKVTIIMTVYVLRAEYYLKPTVNQNYEYITVLTRINNLEEPIHLY